MVSASGSLASNDKNLGFDSTTDLSLSSFGCDWAAKQLSLEQFDRLPSATAQFTASPWAPLTSQVDTSAADPALGVLPPWLSAYGWDDILNNSAANVPNAQFGANKIQCLSESPDVPMVSGYHHENTYGTLHGVDRSVGLLSSLGNSMNGGISDGWASSVLDMTRFSSNTTPITACSLPQSMAEMGAASLATSWSGNANIVNPGIDGIPAFWSPWMSSTIEHATDNASDKAVGHVTDSAATQSFASSVWMPMMSPTNLVLGNLDVMANHAVAAGMIPTSSSPTRAVIIPIHNMAAFSNQNNNFIPVSVSQAPTQMVAPRRHTFRCGFATCGRVFARKSDMDRHTNTVHRNTLQQQPLPLHLCLIAGCSKARGIGYSRADKLTEHMWKKHANLGYTKA